MKRRPFKQKNGGEKTSKSKVSCRLNATLLVFSILFTMMSTVAAQTNTSSTSESWQPPKNFVDPVTLKIQEFKAQGLNDEQITAELEELGMGWYPETGATWMGRSLTAEELAETPHRLPAKASPDGNTITSATKKTSCMRTWNPDWTGVAADMISGSMSVASGETTYQYLCVQLGNLDGSSTSWIETVLVHTWGGNYNWETYDTDEGGWSFWKVKDTPITAKDNYVIMLDGTQDGSGWHYDVWINQNWVRRGHLPNLWVKAGYQKEVGSPYGIFTNDASRSIFFYTWLHNAQGWSYWRTSATWWSTESPLREEHRLYPFPSWAWQTWVQN